MTGSVTASEPVKRGTWRAAHATRGATVVDKRLLVENRIRNALDEHVQHIHLVELEFHRRQVLVAARGQSEASVPRQCRQPHDWTRASWVRT